MIPVLLTIKKMQKYAGIVICGMETDVSNTHTTLKTTKPLQIQQIGIGQGPKFPQGTQSL
jgi:hypothetical protein